MSKLIHLLSVSFVSFALAFFPQLQAGSRSNLFMENAGIRPVAGIHTVNTVIEKAKALFDSLDLDQLGLQQEAFEYAYKGYHYLLEKGLIAKKGLLTICDFSQSSTHKRLYLVDMNTNEVLINTYVAHGKKSGGEFATSFSNSPESHKSSLGFYITGSVYRGNNGLSLRLQGVDKGFNDRAAQRNIVVHGSDYATEQFLQHSNYLGRSYGCPAVPDNEIRELTDIIKEGTCLFIYYPQKIYLERSKVLNG